MKNSEVIIFDHYISEYTQIDLNDINEVWRDAEGFTYLENADGIVYKISTSDAVNKLGIHAIIE